MMIVKMTVEILTAEQLILKKGKRIPLPKDMAKAKVETIRKYLEDHHEEFDDYDNDVFVFIEVDESVGQQFIDENSPFGKKSYIYSGIYFTKPDIAAYNASQSYKEYHIKEDALMEMPPLHYFVCVFTKRI